MSVSQDMQKHRNLLYERMRDRLETAAFINRRLVSFQANKHVPLYRWFKYKEGFSTALVHYFLENYHRVPGKLLDPFAGMGTTLFAGQELGWKSTGIEVLPVGTYAVSAREAAKHLQAVDVENAFCQVWNRMTETEPESVFQHLSITKDAFTVETEDQLNRYTSACNSLADANLKTLLRFAAFAVLEEISFTRKDGQYLRWDYRSQRQLSGKPFDKGYIPSFEEAVKNKMQIILDDLSSGGSLPLFELSEKQTGKNDVFPLQLHEGSCLEILPMLEDQSFDFIMTSPPYCNRYDYTRTYALELAYLNRNNDDIKTLRQAMLSCTVENKEKFRYLEHYYSSINKTARFRKVNKVYHSCPAMSEVNEVLDELNRSNLLNNTNIPRMVKNYFYEMCFVVSEMARVLKSKGYCVMVNDNVRYGGEEVPVDLILSSFAENFGFEIQKIFVLPQAKGNSSQQMGCYGRSEIRKCVYLWQKK
jgi:DNA modification methylase